MIEPFEASKHWDTVRDWLAWHKIPLETPETLPPTGLLSDGIVCGWLFKTDARIAFMDCFVADPFSKPDDRKTAIHALIDALLDKARECGMKAVAGVTTVPALAEKLTEHGFKGEAGTYLVRSL